jgi:serine/threonine protein kinase
MSDSPSPASFIAPDPADLAPLFPGYEIEGLIATGGMGAVYAAVQKSLDRSVAIKILPPELSADAAFRAGFEAEAKAMARLNHPNLIGVYDFGEVSGMLYIIMEFVPGCSLFHSSHGTAIDPAEVVRIVSGICSGLAHAHDNGIIHRDIKPANILLDLNANPKIGDFGLARPADRQIQEGEEIFGTPHYTAPEVVNSPHNVDHRADIFSLGVILHELLTGHLPADDRRPASVISRCDHRFDAIIRRATDPLPENRYSSAHETERELRAITVSAGPRGMRSPVQVSPRVIGRRHAAHATHTAKKSSGNPALTFLLIAAIAAAAAYYIISSNKQPPKETIPVTSEPAAPQTQKPEESTAGNTDEPSLPDPVESDSPEPAPLKHPQPETNKVTEIPHDSGEKTADVLPKFDVSAFLERARKIMHDKAASLIASHDSSLKENLVRFERDAKRVIRKINYRESREKAEEDLADLVKEYQQDKNRIPGTPDVRLENISGLEEIHEERHEIQESIDLECRRSLTQFAPTYILGLEKQIERLKGENDPAAIDAIKEEIDSTRDDKTYFPNLMLEFEADSGSR